MKWYRNEILIGETIREYLKETIEKELSKGYSISASIGTDSQKCGKDGQYKFVTVILLNTFQDLGGGVVVGRGGIVMHTIHYNKFRLRNKELVNERMVYEVGRSVDVAYDIADLLDDFDIKLEIHADINPNPIHESNKALQTAIGWILGMGYNFKVKPEAMASSYCADHLI